MKGLVVDTLIVEVSDGMESPAASVSLRNTAG